jgi:hypothetical protein
MPLPRFETAIDRCLELLRGSHTRVTLFAVAPPVTVSSELEAIICAALAPLGSVGRLPDGRIGLLYLGPHGPDEAGSPRLRSCVSERIERRLLDRGWGDHRWGRPLPPVRIAAVDGWTDGIGSRRDLIDALPPVRDGVRPDR